MFVNGFVNVPGPVDLHSASASSPWSTISPVVSMPPEDQVSESVGNLAVGVQVGLYVLLHGERDVGVSNPPG